MANIIIATPEIFDVSVVSSVGEVEDNVVENLQIIQPGSVWRSDELEETLDVSFDVDVLTDEGINTVWLGYTNLTSESEWRVRASDTTGMFSSPTYDSGRVSFCPVSVKKQKTYDHIGGILHFGDIESRYWRIEIFDDNNPDSFIQAGRLYLSHGFVPNRNLNWGWSSGVGDPSPIVMGQSGARFPLRRPGARSMELPFQLEEEDAWEGINRIDRVRGTSKDVLVCVDHENDKRILDWTVYGILGRPRLIQNPSWKLYEKTWTIEELLP